VGHWWALGLSKERKNASNDNENYLQQFSPSPPKLLRENLACLGCLFNDFFWVLMASSKLLDAN